MPREVFIDEFASRSMSLKNYTKCYYRARTTPQAKKEGPVYVHECIQQSGLEEYCGCHEHPDSNHKQATVANSIPNGCPDYLEIAQKLVASGKENNAMQNVTGNPKKLETFLKYERCKQVLFKSVDPCLEDSKLIEDCQASQIRTTMILGLKMPFMEHFLKAFPDVHIVYYTRDPRAIIASRYGENGPKLPESWKRGVLLLCDEMASDIQALEVLEPEYPGVFLMMKYEDLLAHPEETVASLFSHIDLDPLPETDELLQESLHSVADKVKMTNATLEAHQWRRRFQQSDIDEVSNNPRCERVLNILGYSL